METPDEPAVCRQALQCLNRRELQARAKALGVRANGKSADIINSVVKVLSRPGSPSKAHEHAKSDSDNDNEEEEEEVSENRMPQPEGSSTPGPAASSGAAAPCAQTPAASPLLAASPSASTSTPPASTPAPGVGLGLTTPSTADSTAILTAAATATKRAADALTAACGAMAGTPSLADLAARASAAALAASLTNLRLQSELKPSAARGAPASLLKARAQSQALPLWGQPLGPQGGPPGGLLWPPSVAAVPLTPKLLGQGQGLQSEEVLVAAEGQGGSFGGNAEAVKDEAVEEAVRRLAFGAGASPSPGAGASAGEVGPVPIVPAAGTWEEGYQQEEEAEEHMGFYNDCEEHGADCMEEEEGNGENGPAESQTRWSAGGDGRADVDAGGGGSSSCTPHMRMSTAAAVVAPAATPPPSAPAQHAQTATQVQHVEMTPPPPPAAAHRSAAVPAAAFVAAPVQLPVAARAPSAQLVTDRTPLRTQRLMGAFMVAPLSTAPAPTPGARPFGLLGWGGGGGGGVDGALPRTPGTGLRTPARRVAVVSDEAQARAVDAWVMQHLYSAPSRQDSAPAGTGGVPWRELVGLDDAKRRLKAICFAPEAAPAAARNYASAPAANATPPAGTAVKRRTSTRVASGRAVVRTGGGEVALIARQSSSTTTSTISGGSASTNAHRSPTTSATCAACPHAATTSTKPPPPLVTAINAAVLLCGPPGSGKGCLARALAAELGAAYLCVPRDLLTAGRQALPQTAGHADAVLRSVFRVAAQSAGPVVVHLDEVEQLAGVEAARDSPECRRIRTELRVAIDEVVMSRPPTAALAPSAVAPSTGSAAASAAVPRVRVKVLVLSSSSSPLALDDVLAASLGRTECLLAALPDADAREAFLVGRLAAEGAALGLEQVERLVRRTEGNSCGELAAACDRAVAAAATRQSQGQPRSSSRKSGACSRQQAGTAASAAASSDGGPSNPKAKSGAPVEEADLEAALRGVGRRVAAEAVAETAQWHVRMDSMRP